MCKIHICLLLLNKSFFALEYLHGRVHCMIYIYNAYWVTSSKVEIFNIQRKYITVQNTKNFSLNNISTNEIKLQN